MHDLNTIRRLNAEAHADSINRVRAKGRFVVADYAGLTLMSYRSFEERPHAEAALAEPLEGSEHRKLFEPLPA